MYQLPILKNTSSVLILLVLILLTACTSPRKVIRKTNINFETTRAFEQGFSGIMIYDPAEEKVIYEKNAAKYFTPASNTKLFTFYTGLVILGDSVPALRYLVQQDSLIISGTGDPTFLHKEYPYSKIFSFLKDRDEDLYLAPPAYEEKAFGPGWAWDDYNWYFSAERGAFPMYGNTVNFSFKPEKTTPSIIPSHFSEAVKYDSLNLEKSGAVRDPLSNAFTVKHQLGNKEKDQEVPFKYSMELAAELLSDTLKKPVKLRKTPLKITPQTQTLYSVPADSIYKSMLQESDNFIAEQILLLSAQKISDSLKTENVIHYVIQNHLKDLPDAPVWVDGSGLSIYNKFTPRSLVKLLEKIYEIVPEERLFQLLPAGGKSGTLKNLYKAEEPYIFAKTGSLSNVNALSGYLKTRSGKLLIFSFMNNNHTVPSVQIREGMEKILRDIHLKY